MSKTKEDVDQLLQGLPQVTATWQQNKTLESRESKASYVDGAGFTICLKSLGVASFISQAVFMTIFYQEGTVNWNEMHQKIEEYFQKSPPLDPSFDAEPQLRARHLLYGIIDILVKLFKLYKQFMPISMSSLDRISSEDIDGVTQSLFPHVWQRAIAEVLSDTRCNASEKVIYSTMKDNGADPDVLLRTSVRSLLAGTNIINNREEAYKYIAQNSHNNFNPLVEPMRDAIQKLITS